MRPLPPGVPWPARACALLLLCAACGSTELDTTRLAPPPSTLGEAFFGVLCDRMGALILPEDLSGASFRGVCHRSLDGGYADGVDTSLLPAPSADAVDSREAKRAEAVARLAALARQRPRVVAALDALFPDTGVPVRDVSNPDAALTCGPGTPAEARLHDELAALLGRMTALYGDGTLPDTTRALGTWLESFESSPEAARAWATLDARQGYQPPERVLGLMRPLLTYPGLRDVLDTTTRAVGPTSTPGPARAAFTSLLEVVHHELRTLAPESPRAPLLVTRDDLARRDVVSRPRTGAELLSTLLLTEAGPAPSGPPVLAVRRDGRGVAAVASPGLPFADANADGLPDVDALGRFIRGSTAPVPTPFPVPGLVDTAERDAGGRVRAGPDNAPLYAYVDARHTLLGQVLSEVRPMLAVDGTHPRSTVAELLDGLPVLLGPRDGAATRTRDYPPVTVAYDGFRADEAPLLDLVHAGAQVLGQPSADDTLALLRTLAADHPGEVARLVGLLRFLSRTADAHPEAELKAGNTLRDDLLDVAVEIAREPGLLEDVLKALARPESQGLGQALASHMEHRDAITYDRNALNGPALNASTGEHGNPRTPVDRTQPDAGANRSMLQRFLNVVHDANGVTYCNKANAVVHARGVDLIGDIDLPLFGGTYRECEVFKIDNMAVFYLQSIVGKARLYLRPSILRNGVLGIGATTVSVLEQSSGITGFWTPGNSRDFRPKPEWINRTLVFDQVNDSPTSTGRNYITHRFLRDLQGTQLGSSVCAERVIDDPDPGAPDAAPDGKVRGLRTCPEGEWFLQRTPDSMMVLETEGFYTAIRPLLLAFTMRDREDLFIQVMEALHRHWATGLAPERECRLTRQPGDTRPMCSQAGVSRYERLVAEFLRGDAMGSLQALTQRLQATQVPHCMAVDAATRRCTRTETWDGVRVIAELVRTAIDPDRAGLAGLTDRHGNATHLRQDGVTRAQVTPLSLLIDAFAAEHPGGPDRRAAWDSALSRLSDQFLTVQGERESSSFANPLVPRLLPPALDLLRSELHARCPDTFVPPHARCAWMRDTLTQETRDALGGPLLATGWDFLEAARGDAALRAQVDALADSLLDPDSPDGAWPALLGTSVDVIQWLASDGRQRVALAHLGAEALKADDVVDSALTLGRRVAGKAYAGDGTTRVCAREMDPHDVLPGVLARLVTPTEIPGEAAPRTPWEVLTEAVADIQREVPGQPEPRSAEDYQRIARELASFLLDPEHGLERFYVVANQAGGAP
ncbi:hypothetical protein [Myxococcus sp. RHSTA-1-4]|uniref:hypothetical protein n=1 Tax=Myxococcus sp. RHSTA-1-4 TaxID=2874601 RepID=UPI00272DDFEA|nr:hypothetical protein [Myxococcus sp. RHSTA-1-4]MBZ4418445.1 hypothetical protein [Myxococcus sp. RHSTA-1-4]